MPTHEVLNQPPPLEDYDVFAADAALAEAIAKEIRSALLFTAEVRVVPPQSLPRSEYKSKLVDFSEAA